MRFKLIFVLVAILTMQASILFAEGFNPKDIKRWWLYGEDDGTSAYDDMLNKEVDVRLQPDRLQNIKGIPDDFLKGKYTLIDIWATWCPPCLAAIPENNAIYTKYKERLNVIGVCSSVNSVDFEDVVKDRGIIYPVGVDTSGEISKYFRVKLFPTYHLIDQNGKLVVADIKADFLHKVLEVVFKE